MTDRRTRVPRRTLLTGGLAAVGGAAATAAALWDRNPEPTPPTAPDTVEPFHGARQAGIATRPQGHAVFVAFRLRDGVTADRFAAVLRLLGDDAERLTGGVAALGDTEPELAPYTARLTVTFGFGYGMFDALGVADRRPEGFRPLPAFETDRLDPAFSGGDLLIQVCADDPTTVAHTVRMLTKDARSVMTVAWAQRGFRQTTPVIGEDATPRNVMGQLDGTTNPHPGEPGFEDVVWRRDGSSPGWSTLVVRRIRAEMETWDAVDPLSKEMVIGRRLDTGAPLTGEKESDEPDFDDVDGLGLSVIAPNAHIRRSRLDDGRRIFRRVYNYDDTRAADGTADMGLIFASYQADISTFVDIQRRLDEADMLNRWVTPVGSAEFAIPPGCEAGGWIGETVFT
ncbi:dye decolorizing peroxidase [Stackebrandtia albiflava]|uniref:Dye decolorizing peroxidase n=1 Tax=Stackebrandtia albiflava TaxID=406432 RepID=A0A562UQA1_9ACTN|nr:Dyp-type peroxidase [Stackebrandtia albiflava]TWJ07788.1 dye decolorizing peroxidase [Stackebrandtia albiflava]